MNRLVYGARRLHMVRNVSRHPVCTENAQRWHSIFIDRLKCLIEVQRTSKVRKLFFHSAICERYG